ncbi:MAG: ADP-glyceromanno-heptose 6-epimerase [Saprospiraceae bacterium]|nr:ADP-glyceromanno-heptose 6-epimerase [Saprospiraceae bacterium]
MIILTGAAGFIGSCLLRKLNDEGHTDLLLVDDFSHADKDRNLEGKQFLRKMDRRDFLTWFPAHASEVSFVFHLGARTDTTEQDVLIFDELNLNYSEAIWQVCAANNIPLVYASSAATYGAGEHGYDDSHDVVTELRPLNPYGVSKNDFDKWVLDKSWQSAVGSRQSGHQSPITNHQSPPFWAGLKFFNVYGPNEYHKGRMASVILQTVKQIRETGSMRLFRSHRPDYADGGQLRDFIYVKDVVEVCYFFYQNQTAPSGLYNVGTGKARSFWDLATNTFRAMGLEPSISFVDTPADIRDTYQYFTEAKMDKLRAAGYAAPFYSLEDGIEDYVKNYLLETKLW